MMTTTEIIGGYFLIMIVSVLILEIRSKMKLKSCKHKQRYTKVITSTLGCETTAEVCLNCDKILSEPKTDCR